MDRPKDAEQDRGDLELACRRGDVPSERPPVLIVDRPVHAAVAAAMVPWRFRSRRATGVSTCLEALLGDRMGANDSVLSPD